MNTKNENFLIAVNWFDETKSKILLENMTGEINKEQLKIDLSSLIGQGLTVDVCTLAEPGADEEDVWATLDYQGETRNFVFASPIREFPLIENAVEPGIYFLAPESGQYFALKDNRDLTFAFNVIDCPDPLDSFKLICLPDRIRWQATNSDDFVDFLRHEFSFFDVPCPICETKVVAGEVDDAAYPLVNRVYTKCPHFAGTAFIDTGDYDEGSLADLYYEFRLDDDLRLLNSDGIWEYPLIYEFPDGADSFWASDESYSHWFLFINRDPAVKFPN